MDDKQLVSEVISLQKLFYGHKGQPGAGGIDYGKQAEAMESVVGDIRNRNYFLAAEKLETVRHAFNSAAYKLTDDIKHAPLIGRRTSRLNEDKACALNIVATLDRVIYHVNNKGMTVAAAEAADDTDQLMAAAKNLKRNMTYENRYSADHEIADFLILATKNQLRQEKLLAAQAAQLKEMSAKITTLEQKLAEDEQLRTLDKPKIKVPRNSAYP